MASKPSRPDVMAASHSRIAADGVSGYRLDGGADRGDPRRRGDGTVSFIHVIRRDVLSRPDTSPRRSATYFAAGLLGDQEPRGPSADQRCSSRPNSRGLRCAGSRNTPHRGAPSPSAVGSCGDGLERGLRARRAPAAARAPAAGSRRSAARTTCRPKGRPAGPRKRGRDSTGAPHSVQTRQCSGRSTASSADRASPPVERSEQGVVGGRASLQLGRPAPSASCRAALYRSSDVAGRAPACPRSSRSSACRVRVSSLK